MTDQTGAVVPSAKVTIQNLATRVSRISFTNERGNYAFSLVEVSDYAIRCELAGFKTAVASQVRVETGAQARRNFVLEPGDVAETIEVIASGVQLITENATVSSVVDNRRVTELPLNGRNVGQLAVLAPGVQFGDRAGRADGLGGAPIPGSSIGLVGNGVRELHQVVTLDGVDAKDARLNTTPFVPSIDAIEEFKVQTSAYDARIGFGGGAIVSITMKSGTNEFHGSVFEFLRNDTLNAENYFLNFELPAGADRRIEDTRRRNQFGAFFRGPLVKNKTFWAAGWEAQRQIETFPGFEWYPLDSFRAGDFSELLTGTINPETGNLFRRPIVIYDPHTGDPFTNNIVPQSRQHRGVVDNILPQFMPRARFRQADPLDFTELRGVPQKLNKDQYYGRLDHYFSESDRVFGRILQDLSDFDTQRTNPNFGAFNDSDTTNVSTQWVHTFGAQAINELRVGFQTANQKRFHPRTNDESFDLDALGIGPIRAVADNDRVLTTEEHGLPIFPGFFPVDTSWIDQPDSLQISDHISMIRGHHNLKMGYELYQLAAGRTASNAPNGRLAFSNFQTGSDIASLLMGFPNSTLTPQGWRPQTARAGRQGAYIHDDWKVSVKLTLNLGLRFDYNGNPREINGEWRTLDFPGGGRGLDDFVDPERGQLIPTFGPELLDERAAIKLWKQDVRFFMPRAGIAYRPTDKWVIRVGAGWFDNLMHQNNFTILNLNPPKSVSFQFNSVVDNAQTIPVVAADGASYSVTTRMFRENLPVITLNDPFFINSLGNALQGAINSLYIPPDYKDGDVWKWSFDIQRELPFDTLFTVGYVGSKSSHIANSLRNWNSPLPSPDRNIQANRPYQRVFDPATPEFGVRPLGVVRYLDSYGNAFHHALQGKLDKRFSHGLTFGLAYTYSKTHGDGEAGGNEGAQFQSPRFDRRADRGRLRFDQRHIFVGHFVWEMPGAGLPGPLKHIVGGWQSNGIVSLRTGFPFGLTQSTGDLNVRDSAIRPDLVGNARLDNPTRKLWYNPQAFQRVTCNIPDRLDLCHFGNLGYNVLDSPGQKNVDFGLFKNIPLNDRFRLQLRSEFFNVLNTPYFGSPDPISFRSQSTLTPDDPRDGEIRQTRTPMRIVQFGAKITF